MYPYIQNFVMKKSTGYYITSALLGYGSDLIFRAVTRQVPSALKGLTSVFGKRTGGSPSP